MRFFHLADLHLGKNLLGFSLMEDQTYILEQILALIRQERPDTVLLSGDIYDKPLPSVEAVRLFDHFLTALADLQIPLLAIAGNHDSPERLSFGEKIMARQSVHIVGRFRGYPEKVTMHDAHGPVHFYLLPFIKPSLCRSLFPEEAMDSYEDALRVALSAIPLEREERNVLLAHQLVLGADTPFISDSEIHIGGQEAVSAALFSEFDYVALGHLHGPQKAGELFIRYAGSPLKYSFSECGHKKSIPLVEMGAKGDLTLQLLPLTPLRDLRKIRGPLLGLIEEEVLAQSNSDDYLHVTLTDREELADPLATLRQFYPHVAQLAWEKAPGGDFSAPSENTAPLDAFPLFDRFFSERNGHPMDAQQAEAIHLLLDEERETP